MTLPLLELLCCPHDYAAPLREETDALVCPTCRRRFQILDKGLVSFLSTQEMSEQHHRERASRDRESSGYDAMFEGYANAVEVPSAVRRIGRPAGPILDAGCGTGRITQALLALGQPILAVDFSEPSLRMMIDRTRDGPVPVLGIQSDLRMLPLRPARVAATICVQVYGHLREDDRSMFLSELERVMAPSAVLSMSAYNYNIVFRAWAWRGNPGAREGEHMLGGDFYYLRMTKRQYRRELETHFEVDEITTTRNIPARSIAGALQRFGLNQAGERFLDWMVRSLAGVRSPRGGPDRLLLASQSPSTTVIS